MTSTPPKYKVNSDDDLGAVWQKLMGRGGFGRRSLWMVFLDGNDETLPVIFPMDDLPDAPEPLLIGSLRHILDELLATTPAVAVSFLLSRPGPDAVTEFDRRWTRTLLDTVPPPTRRGPMHLATANRVRVIGPDDLLGAAS